jgi:hypothetical protein
VIFFSGNQQPQGLFLQWSVRHKKIASICIALSKVAKARRAIVTVVNRFAKASQS